ncbi:MAG: hypothetical protein A3J73_02325 [Planctomycetes bacterium RIFCSPHIGHO2_02_FULL_38_41]|nr:MAG: hypothetical protein A3J73_02325 [Planctomycetes bacterium RIFCSPHIGHO2_02_FULL_38_41]
MNEILTFLASKLDQTEKIITSELLAKQYVVKQLGILEDSADFSLKLEQIEKKIKENIKRTNERFEKDGFKAPFVIKGSSGNLIAKGGTFNNLKETFLLLEEKAHDFAERIGRELLRKIGCREEKIFITPKTADEGIDYYGEILFPVIVSNPPHRLLVIGQVKQYSGNIPVATLREFVGAVKTTLATNFFGESYTEHTPIILQFVTTGELTESGKRVAESNNIHIINKRHLIEMGILKGSSYE